MVLFACDYYQIKITQDCFSLVVLTTNIETLINKRKSANVDKCFPIEKKLLAKMSQYLLGIFGLGGDNLELKYCAL